MTIKIEQPSLKIFPLFSQCLTLLMKYSSFGVKVQLADGTCTPTFTTRTKRISGNWLVQSLTIKWLSYAYLKGNLWKITAEICKKSISLRKALQAPFMRIQNEFQWIQNEFTWIILPSTKAGLTLDIYVGKFAAQRCSLPLYLSSNRLFWNLRL